MDEEDTARVTQVICIGESLRDDEVLNRLRVARNELTKLHYKDTMDLAQQVDMVIWKLQSLLNGENDLPSDYDYNRIIEIKQAIGRGEWPMI